MATSRAVFQACGRSRRSILSEPGWIQPQSRPISSPHFLHGGCWRVAGHVPVS